MPSREKIRYVFAVTLLAAIAILTIGITWIILYPWLVPTDIPGTGEIVTVKTTVVIRNDLGFDPYIKDITNVIVSDSTVLRVNMVKTLFWPIDDTVMVKLTVIAPDGKTITNSKIVKVGEMADTPVSFTWRTGQRGIHTVMATLYKEDGTQLSEKTVTLNV